MDNCFNFLFLLIVVRKLIQKFVKILSFDAVLQVLAFSEVAVLKNGIDLVVRFVVAVIREQTAS